MTDTVTKAVIDAEQARCAAMLSGDLVALGSLLDLRLAFHHSNGAVDDKAAFMTKMAAGRIAYVSIVWEGATVTVLGDSAAILTGKMITVVKVEGVEKTLENRVLEVWAHTAGAWAMVAFQSTPLK